MTSAARSMTPLRGMNLSLVISSSQRRSREVIPS
jgi:hypothetical protein